MSRIWGQTTGMGGRRWTLVALGIVIGALFVPHGAAFAVKTAQAVFVTNGPNDPVQVSDAAARTAVRFEKSYFFSTATDSDRIVVPTVPEGKTFLISYINVSGGSAVSGTVLTAATCTVSRRWTEGSSTKTSTVAALPVALSGGQNIAVSESMSLPLVAGEKLLFHCNIQPQQQSGVFTMNVVGHYVPATN